MKITYLHKKEEEGFQIVGGLGNANYSEKDVNQTIN